MDRTTRAQQRAAAIDVSPARLAAEIERLTRERDLARRQTELAREEVARLKAGVAGSGPAGPGGAPSVSPTITRQRGDGRASKGDVEELTRQRDEYLAALQRERAEFTNFKRRTTEEREAMLGLAAESLIRSVILARAAIITTALPCKDDLSPEQQERLANTTPHGAAMRVKCRGQPIGSKTRPAGIERSASRSRASAAPFPVPPRRGLLVPVRASGTCSTVRRLADQLISTTSPVGKSLMGKQEGDEVVVRTPAAVRNFEIRQLRTLHDELEANK